MKTIRFFLPVLFLVLLFSATGCLEEFLVSGNRSPVTETRYARDFNQVTSSGSFVVNIVPGDQYRVEVHAESNLQEYIETDVYNHTLRISTRGCYNIHNHTPMEVTITCPDLDGLRLSGSGSITAGRFVSDNFEATVSGSGDINAEIDALKVEADVSGSGKITLNGVAKETDFNISGSGKIDSYDLVQESCKANVSGSGAMYVNVSKNLDVTISGSGRVFYINTPAIHSRISGSGEIVNRN